MRRLSAYQRRFSMSALAAVTAVLVSACGSSSMQTTGSGGAGGGTGEGGAGGEGGADVDAGGTGGAGGVVVDAGPDTGPYVAPACDQTASTMGRVTTPSPLIALMGKRTATSAGVLAVATAFDGKYRAGSPTVLPVPTAAAPAWISVEVGAGPTRLLLMWSDRGFGNYNALSGGAPVAYTISVSGDTTDGTDGTWTPVADVTDNPVRNRAHSFDFTGKSWVRFTATAGPAAGANVQLDEIEVHDISASGTGRPADTWFFMGDSITAGAFKRSLASPFEGVVKTAKATFDPIVLNGGIGGELSSMGVAHIDQWLALNPDFQHIAILYGTNDSWGDKDPAGTGMEGYLNTIVDKVLAAGRVPVLARIPYATVAHATLPSFNAVIDRIATQKALPCGPDFYAFFQSHPEQLSADGVHPSDRGYVSMTQTWGAWALPLYP